MAKIIIFLFIAVFGFYYENLSNETNYNLKRKKYIYLIAFVLFIQSGLRKWDVGINSDTQQYYYIFDSVKHMSWQYLLFNLNAYLGKDPFYNILQKIFQLFSDSYQLYLLFLAGIIMSAIANFLYENTTKIRHAIMGFTIYMGYFYGFFSLTGTRQALATAFLLFSFKYIKARKLIYFFVLVTIASLFHITALVFLPLYFIANLKKPKLLIGFATIGFPIVFSFKNQLATFFVGFAGMEDRFGNYTEQYFRGGSLILTIFSILLGLLSLIIYKKVIKVYPPSFRNYNMYALALFFLPLQWVNPTAGRISQYFSIVMIVWIPFLLDAFAGNNIMQTRLIYTLTFILFVGLTMFTISYGNQYEFFWQ